MEKQLNFKKSDGLIFGIYPGSGVGIEMEGGSGLIKGKTDDPNQIHKGLHYLSGSKPFLVRAYTQYVGFGIGKYLTPSNVEQYCNDNRKLDLAICYRTNDSNMDDWKSFIRKIITEYKDVLEKLQITEEPNNPDGASGGDGGSLYVKQAIIEGILAAKEEIQHLGLDIQLGFNAVISFDPNDTFWKDMANLSSPAFVNALDYIGLDFYPGVFRPLPPNVSLKEAVKMVLSHFRNQNLVEAGIPQHIPLHITENGWPTNELRTEAQQAEAIEQIIKTVFEVRKALNITHYEFFDLRDCDILNNGLQFGLMREDYTPKPAFNVFARTINELG
ncbi:hypothetical protein [Emticicia sp. SJ17W-69]|uniref:hypothetical protein n=1 Tax=Emticicia sp. SJ17W-69 TaxID=3421657 RepID=UPI003EC05DA1